MRSSSLKVEVEVRWSEKDQFNREEINKNKGVILYITFSWLIIKILNKFLSVKKETLDTELSN